MKSRLLFVSLLVGIACDRDEPASIKYLNEVMDVMEQNSINRKTIDWGKFRGDVIASTNGGTEDADVNRALKTALIALGDDHSFVLRGSGSMITASNHTNCTSNFSGIVDVPDNIGYIKVPGFAGNDPQYSINMQEQIKQQDNEDLVGWIVDLRGNTGGDPFPMLAGVGPILGNGVVGYFIDPDETIEEWGYFFGKALLDQSEIVDVPSPYTLINSTPKVAVLFDKACGSAGEAVAIAFIGRPNTTSFGTPTCGLSTSNKGFFLSDGGRLNLTTAVMADRNKNKKGGPVSPDVIVEGDQEVINKAIEWLNAQ